MTVKDMSILKSVSYLCFFFYSSRFERQNLFTVAFPHTQDGCGVTGVREKGTLFNIPPLALNITHSSEIPDVYKRQLIDYVTNGAQRKRAVIRII